MKDNISPEEKLLRLIRGGKNTEEKPVIRKPIQTFSSFYSNPANIHKSIYILLAISAIFLLTSFIYPWVGLKKIKLPDISKEKVKDKVSISKKEAKPYEFYLEGLKRRQIFATSSIQGAGISTVASQAGSIKDMNLVGIISGENPQAIIEDKKTQKTYYVAKGQFIGDFQVEDIQEGKIILNAQGQRFELSI
jgi:type II secretory pathway component PulC